MLLKMNSEERAKKNRVYMFFYSIVTSVTFNFLIYCIIVSNTIALSLYRFDQSKQQEQFLHICDFVFVWIYTIEMIMKFLGLGIKNYFRDNFNIFDCFIVIVSLVDFTLMTAMSHLNTSDDILGSL